ncbi:MAG: hypothetical protein ACOVN5_12460 [Aquidulcibacter sp.]
MPTKREYIRRIEESLNNAMIYTRNEGELQFSDVFEGYIWSLVLQAAADEGADISFESVNGTNPLERLLFRTSPGFIYSIAEDYTHAVLSFRDINPQLEAHIGVYVSGQSKVLHECDVLVLSRNEAATCRINSVHPRSHKVLIAAECKHYTTTLGINLARSFLGWRLDIKRDNRFFVSNTTSKSVEAIIANHNGQQGVNINLLANDQSDHLIHQFRRVFWNFKAKDGKI